MFTDSLDIRLKTIAYMVRHGARLADVGCDHGYLISALARDGIITGGIACDINKGPLDNAKVEIARCRLEDKIECRLGNGLGPVKCEEVDDIVIAGMGGELIAAIIEGSGWNSFEGKHFILQPMSRAAYLRRWLKANGFCVREERACSSNKHVYTVISAVYSGEKVELAEYDLYCYLGELIKDKSEDADEYLRRTVSELEKQRKGASFNDPEREKKLAKLISEMNTVLEEGR